METKNSASHKIAYSFLCCIAFLLLLVAWPHQVCGCGPGGLIKSNMRQVQLAAEEFALSKGRYPGSLTELAMFFPGGNPNKGIAGNPLQNPYVSDADSIVIDPRLATEGNITWLRNNPAWKSGHIAGQVVYHAFENQHKYAIVGIGKNGFPAEGPDGTAMVLCNVDIGIATPLPIVSSFKPAIRQNFNYWNLFGFAGGLIVVCGLLLIRFSKQLNTMIHSLLVPTPKSEFGLSEISNYHQPVPAELESEADKSDLALV